MKAKVDCLGNPVILDGTKLYVFHKNTGVLKSLTVFMSKESAKMEFNRITCTYRGCGNNVYMKHPQAKVFYGQLIING